MSTETPSTGNTGMKQSRVGKRPVSIPKGVTARIADGQIHVKGPKGELSCKAIPNVKVEFADATVQVTPTLGGRDGARFQGLARALIASMVNGAANGYTKTLQLVGTGYRAEVKGNTLNLSLGFSHPINFPIPAGVKIDSPGDSQGTIINMTGPDKGVMGQLAAKIRGFRPPEPYGGKGVRYMGEKVRQKAGKAGAKGGK